MTSKPSASWTRWYGSLPIHVSDAMDRLSRYDEPCRIVRFSRLTNQVFSFTESSDARRTSFNRPAPIVAFRSSFDHPIGPAFFITWPLVYLLQPAACSTAKYINTAIVTVANSYN
jgi:hypothetical protein